jgi:multidrug efflux pump subunit AcrA (membrane-fusion protein)
MTASAVLTAADGSVIYPYDSAETAYYRTSTITTKAGGPAEQVSLLNYAEVSSAEALLVLGAEDTESLILAKEQDVDAAQEDLDEAQEALDNFNAVAPISGTVISCSLLPGQEVASGLAAITISDTSVMTVEIQVDERNIGYIKPGMSVDLDQWGNIYTGVVESVSLEAKAENGMATFPATVKVDNASGQLMSGMYVAYSFVASQSDNCLVIPIQCVRYINDESGSPVTVVCLQADQQPENTVTLGEEAAADLPEGFYAVPVTTGLSDTYNIEITGGLNEGDMVFTNYETNQGDSFSNGMMKG